MHRLVRTLTRATFVALFAGLLHVVGVAPASADSPVGTVDYIASESPGYVTISGWTADPDNPSVNLFVHVYVGSELFVLLADKFRSQYGDNYGFSATVAVSTSGDLAWSATGMDSQNAGNSWLGGGTINVADPTPTGAVESLTSPAHRTINVAGWASDPNAPVDPLEIQVYVGGDANTSGAEYHKILANIPRTDGRTGFSQSFTTAKTGSQSVFVYAINLAGSPGGNRLISSSKVTIFVDATPPDTKITEIPTTATPSDVIQVKFSATEANSTFECRWDAAPFAACQPTTTVSLTPGQHTVAVRAKDAYGNTDPTPATAVVSVTDYVSDPPPPGAGRTLGVRAVKKKSKLRINVGPDSASDNYAIVIQRKVGKKWRKVMVVRTRGDKHMAVVNVRRGKYRAVLMASAAGPAMKSKTVRIKR